MQEAPVVLSAFGCREDGTSKHQSVVVGKQTARNLKLMALPRVTSVVIDAKTRFRVDLHRALQNQSQLVFEGEEKRGVESEEASFMMEPEFIVGPPKVSHVTFEKLVRFVIPISLGDSQYDQLARSFLLSVELAFTVRPTIGSPSSLHPTLAMTIMHDTFIYLNEFRRKDRIWGSVQQKEMIDPCVISKGSNSKSHSTRRFLKLNSGEINNH
ncbi:hypothetical protein HZH66_006803 [Vespula vulgaris]|uniref:Uncharacterized protein n=1 Tax=Vespula vulgaris TaxID=7454 RepID=A0A834K494_VESVU|nr:hypothetical protein HZH66_006803 [Vespula vulgaris]